MVAPGQRDRDDLPMTPAASPPEETPPSGPEWAGLVAQVRQGDETAARRLVESLYPKVIQIVRNHKPKTVDEEDLMQDIFLKMFSKIEQFKGSQPFDHWVSRIAVNTCYDRLRQQKARRVLSFSDFSLDEAAFLESSATAEVEDEASTHGEQSGELLEKLLSTLKAAEQVVIRLLDLEEKSIAEVCNLTGWGTSRVKVTAFRARRKLAATLKRLESETEDDDGEK
jgi:RNA polymerase sigma factor (sigma-70 family)